MKKNPSPTAFPEPPAPPAPLLPSPTSPTQQTDDESYEHTHDSLSYERYRNDHIDDRAGRTPSNKSGS